VEALDGGTRSSVTVDFDLEAHGVFGKLMRPLALSMARKQVPKDQAKLKHRLESGAA
jgi:hypothetical protein